MSIAVKNRTLVLLIRSPHYSDHTGPVPRVTLAVRFHCMYVMLLLDDLHHGCQTFRDSSKTPQSKFTRLLPFLQTIELPFVVITYSSLQHYMNNYVQLLTPCVFPSTVQSYIILGQGVARHYYDNQCYIAISIVAKKQSIMLCILKYGKHKLPSYPFWRMGN